MKSDEKGVVWEGTELTKKKYGKQIGNFVNGVLRNVTRDILDIRNNLEKSQSQD